MGRAHGKPSATQTTGFEALLGSRRGADGYASPLAYVATGKLVFELTREKAPDRTETVTELADRVRRQQLNEQDWTALGVNLAQVANNTNLRSVGLLLDEMHSAAMNDNRDAQQALAVMMNAPLLDPDDFGHHARQMMQRIETLNQSDDPAYVDLLFAPLVRNPRDWPELQKVLATHWQQDTAAPVDPGSLPSPFAQQFVRVLSETPITPEDATALARLLSAWTQTPRQYDIDGEWEAAGCWMTMPGAPSHPVTRPVFAKFFKAATGGDGESRREKASDLLWRAIYLTTSGNVQIPIVTQAIEDALKHHDPTGAAAFLLAGINHPSSRTQGPCRVAFTAAQTVGRYLLDYDRPEQATEKQWNQRQYDATHVRALAAQTLSEYYHDRETNKPTTVVAREINFLQQACVDHMAINADAILQAATTLTPGVGGLPVTANERAAVAARGYPQPIRTKSPRWRSRRGTTSRHCSERTRRSDVRGNVHER